MDEKDVVVTFLVAALLWFSPWFRVGIRWGLAALTVIAGAVLIVNPGVLDALALRFDAQWNSGRDEPRQGDCGTNFLADRSMFWMAFSGEHGLPAEAFSVPKDMHPPRGLWLSSMRCRLRI